MRWVSLATLGFVLLASIVTGAQTSKGETAKQPGVYAKGVNLAGKVSNDGKTLVTDDDNIWIVTNADILKGFEGRDATLKCRMDPDHHAIRVLTVVEPELKHPANLSDSAFRR